MISSIIVTTCIPSLHCQMKWWGVGNLGCCAYCCLLKLICHFKSSGLKLGLADAPLKTEVALHPSQVVWSLSQHSLLTWAYTTMAGTDVSQTSPFLANLESKKLLTYFQVDYIISFLSIWTYVSWLIPWENMTVKLLIDFNPEVSSTRCRKTWVNSKMRTSKEISYRVGFHSVSFWS